MRRITVLHVIDSLALGGAETMLTQLVNRLDRSVVRPAVCITRSELTLADRIAPDVEIEVLERHGRWSPAAFGRFGRLVRRLGVDLLHAHGYGSGRFAVTAQLWNASRRPLVLHGHSSLAPRWGTRLAARAGVHHFIGVSPEAVSWAQRLFALEPRRTTLLPNFVDPADYDSAPPLDLRRYVAVRPRYVGIVVANLRPVKDHGTLFRALAASRYVHELALLVVGDESDPEYAAHCRGLVDELGMRGRIIFLGRRADIPQLLAAVDFAVLSSLRESGPVALLEYMAAAVPFVVTKAGWIGDLVVTHGLHGTVPPGHPASLAAEIDRLLTLTPAERRARGARGRELLMENFEVTRQLKRLQALYAMLVGNGAGNGSGGRS